MALAPSAGTTQELDDSQIASLKRLWSNKDKLDTETRAMVEMLGPQYGFTDSEEWSVEKSPAAQGLKKAALPLIGQYAGGIIEGALTRGADTTAGQSIGGMLGTAANEALGITKPDPMDYFLSGMAAPVGRVGAAGMRAVVPGKEAALQQLAVPKMQAIAGQTSRRGVNAAYEALTPFKDLPIPAGHLNEAFGKLKATENVAKEFGLGSGAITKLVSKGEQALASRGGSVAFGDAITVLKRLREKVSGMEGKGGEAWGAYKAARKALFDDLDDVAKAGGTQGTAVVKYAAARTAAKEAIAQDELASVIAKDGVKTVTMRGQTFEVIEPTKVLNKLKKMEYAQSVDKATWAGIENTLKELAKIPQPTTTFGVALGPPGRLLATAGTGGTAALMGIGGGSMEAAAGAAAALGIHEGLARLAMSDKGRAFLVRVFKANEGRMGERTAAMLQFVASQLQDSPQEGQ